MQAMRTRIMRELTSTRSSHTRNRKQPSFLAVLMTYPPQPARTAHHEQAAAGSLACSSQDQLQPPMCSIVWMDFR